MFEDQENEQTTPDISAESVSTSASQETAGAAESNSSAGQESERANSPSLDVDPWDFSESAEETVVTPEKPENETVADPAEKQEDAAAAVEEENKEAAEKSDEDEILDEVFEGEKVDLDKLDPEKMIASQRNKIARAWAEKNHKKAEIVRDFQNPEKPIEEVLESFSQTAPERFGELSKTIVHSVVDKNPDAAFQRAYIVKKLAQDPTFDFKTAKIPSLDEIISGAPASQSQSVQSNPELSGIADRLTETLGFDWRNPEKDSQLTAEELPMVQMIRTLEAENAKTGEEKTNEQKAADERYKALEAQLNEIKGNLAETGDAKLEEAQSTVGREFRDSVEDKLIPRIAKKRGLEIAEGDTEEVKTVKNLLRQEYVGTDYERENGIGTKFESFAFNQSSVAKNLKELQTRIGTELDKAASLRAKGKTAEAKAVMESVGDDRISLITYLAKADDEFAEKFIAPYWKLLGVTSAALAQNNREAAERIEVTDGSAGNRPAPVQTDYATADDVWGGMTEESRQADRLRTGQ